MTYNHVARSSHTPMFDGGAVRALEQGPTQTITTRSRLMFMLLCVVVVISMCNGLVKQATNWSQVAYIALDLPWVAFLFLWAIWGRRSAGKPSGGVGFLIVTIFAYSAIQVLNPMLDSPFMAIGALRNRLLPMLFFWIGKDLLVPGRARFMMLGCFAVAAAAALLGIYQWQLGLERVSSWGPGFVPRTSLAWRTAEGESILRPLSIYQDGGIAALFGGAVIFCMAMVYVDRRSYVITWMVRIAGMLCVIFATVSGVRAAVLCAIGGLMAAALLSAKRVIPLGLVLGAAAAVMVAMGAHLKLAERYATIMNPIEAYATNRGEIANGFVQLITYSPLGYGTGAASPANDFYAKTFGGVEDPIKLSSDNGYGNLAAEGGIPLVLLYVALLLCIMRQAWRRRHTVNPVRSVAQGVFVFTSILLLWSATALPIDWQPTNILYWLLAGSLFTTAAAPAAPKRPREVPLEDRGLARLGAIEGSA